MAEDIVLRIKLVRCSPRRLCVLPILPVGSHLWGQLPIKMVEPVGNAPTRIVRLKAGCPSIVALTP